MTHWADRQMTSRERKSVDAKVKVNERKQNKLSAYAIHTVYELCLYSNFDLLFCHGWNSALHRYTVSQSVCTLLQTQDLLVILGSVKEVLLLT